MHISLSTLVELLPAQVHLLLATRTDPPLPLSRLRGRGQMLEVRTDQLRCTPEETASFLEQVMGIVLSGEQVQEVTTRTEGWLVGLQMVGLWLQGHTDPQTLLDALSWSQRYILDYLVDEVLGQQEASVQTFLQHTSILERLSAPLCDAVLERSGSQQVLDYLERANVFVVALDAERRWYRYHQLFAEALRYRLERWEGAQGAALHLRASRWYAGQGFTSEAVQHALCAQAWERVAELIESLILQRRDQTVIQHGQIRRWFEQLPVEVIRSSPRLCYTYAFVLWVAAQYDRVDTWVHQAEAGITSSLSGKPGEQEESAPSVQAERENLLGEILSLRALQAGHRGESEAALSLGQEALAYFPEQNSFARSLVATAHYLAHSRSGDIVQATQSALTASKLAQDAGYANRAVNGLCLAALGLLWQGCLHQTEQILAQAINLATISNTLILPIMSFAYTVQTHLWWEWSRLDDALDVVRQAIHLSEENGNIGSLPLAYTGLARVELARVAVAAAARAVEHAEQIAEQSQDPILSALHIRNIQVQCWMARGEIERAIHWAEGFLRERNPAPLLAQEREEVALVRVLLAQKRSSEALLRLAPLLEQATRQGRWGCVIEMRLLEALAFQMESQEHLALASLAQAVQLAEPEGYIRSFVREPGLREF